MSMTPTQYRYVYMLKQQTTNTSTRKLSRAHEHVLLKIHFFTFSCTIHCLFFVIFVVSQCGMVETSVHVMLFPVIVRWSSLTPVIADLGTVMLESMWPLSFLDFLEKCFVIGLGVSGRTKWTEIFPLILFTEMAWITSLKDSPSRLASCWIIEIDYMPRLHDCWIRVLIISWTVPGSVQLAADDIFKYFAILLWQVIFTQGQFCPSGFVVAYVCPCVRVYVCVSINQQIVRVTFCHPLKLESPNLDQKNKNFG